MGMKPPILDNEADRLESLYSYKILDTEQEKFFDDITKLASLICGTDIALLTFIDKDRQWIKSRIGLDTTETTRDEAFCAYAIQQSELMVISDPLQDDRFRNNPLVVSDPHIRFYAGAPLRTEEGYGLGSLCVIDSKEVKLSNFQLKSLELLRDIAVNQLSTRKKLMRRKVLEAELQRLESKVSEINKELEGKDEKFLQISRLLSHDLKAPMRAIASLTKWIIDDHGVQMNSELKEQIELIGESIIRLNDKVDEIILYSKEKINPPDKTNTD